MRQFKYSCLFVLLTGICNAQTYDVKGNVKGLKNDSLLVLGIKGKNTLVKKVSVVEGRFYFDDTLQEPYFVQVFKLKKGSNEIDGKLTEFLAEPGHITIDGQSDHFEAIVVHGSVADLVLKKYLKEDGQVVAKWENLKKEYDQYVIQKDTLNRKKVGEQLNMIIFKERLPLLKTYVYNYKDSMVGALLPNFCMLKEVLKKEDYLEMYNMLTDRVKQTDYAKSTFEKSR